MTILLEGSRYKLSNVDLEHNHSLGSPWVYISNRRLNENQVKKVSNIMDTFNDCGEVRKYVKKKFGIPMIIGI